ncbi:MAG TPA: PDZ domain-containing protein [Isosphaeraceae bacterium]|nr:PDZ domain-containing protein [Isosphaeraceae bacterium]
MGRRISFRRALSLPWVLLLGATASAQALPDPDPDRTQQFSEYFFQANPQQMQHQAHGGVVGQHPWGHLNQFFFVNTNSFSGMSLAPVTEPVRAHLKLPKDQGLLVTSLESHSPAAMAGIRRNDVLLKLGETPLGKVEDLEEALKAAGDKPVKLSLLRGGQPQQIPVQPRVQVMLGPVQPEAPEFWIGVSVTPIEPALRAQLQLSPNEGLSVNDVVKESAAAQAGLKVHDILLRLGGKPLTDQAKMIEIVQANGGKPIPVELIRGGEHLTVNVTPQRRKRLGLFWRAEPRNTFQIDVVRPGAVLSEGFKANVIEGDSQNPVFFQSHPAPHYQSYLPRPQPAPAEVSKRLDQMAEEIKQMRRAIEELSKATKEKN